MKSFIKVVGEDKVHESYKSICTMDGRHIALIFGEPGGKEVCSIKIIGPNDDPAKWLAVAHDVERQCVALFEFGKRESLSLAGINIRIMEAICCKLINLAMIYAATGLYQQNWIKNLSKAETTLIGIMASKGVLGGISNKAIKTGMLVAQ